MLLARIPFWGWLLIILTALYLVYNPLGFSLVHMWVYTDPSDLLPFKILGTLLVLVIIGLVMHGAATTMSIVGIAALFGIVGAVIWCIHTLVSFDFLNIGFWTWAAQPIIATVLTVGWQWPKIWRRSTGAVSVSDPDTPVPHN